MSFRVHLASPEATQEWGVRLGERLFPYAVLTFEGELGAGKTTLIRGIAQGLGVTNSCAVTSPTFALLHEYPARLPLFHFDAYRLHGAWEFWDFGGQEAFDAGGVSLIEWPSRIRSAIPADHLQLTLTHISASTRDVAIAASGPIHTEWLERFQSSLVV
jgi:tRNA threonylcarbamoyladenosine biosynthesis protein TsaE